MLKGRCGGESSSVILCRLEGSIKNSGNDRFMLRTVDVGSKAGTKAEPVPFGDLLLLARAMRKESERVKMDDGVVMRSVATRCRMVC